MEQFEFEIVDQVGVISENSKGWRRELNVIKWNGKAPKYDLRDWSPDHLKISKGITMSKIELIKLRDLLNEIDLT